MKFKTPILISRTESILIIDNFNNMILHSNPVQSKDYKVGARIWYSCRHTELSKRVF